MEAIDFHIGKRYLSRLKDHGVQGAVVRIGFLLPGVFV